jgi:4-aminobutyrate aminotransferase
MLGMQLGPAGDRTAAEVTDTVLERMKDARYLLGKTGPGRDVLTWMPPLIITTDELQGAVDALATVLETL